MEKLTGQALADKWVETRSKFCETCGYPQARRPECTYSNGWYRYRRGDGSHYFHSARAPNIREDITNWERRIAEEPANQAAEKAKREAADKAWLITQAAPDLLAALEAALQVMNTIGENLPVNDVDDRFDYVFADMEAAIAKAKGE